MSLRLNRRWLIPYTCFVVGGVKTSGDKGSMSSRLGRVLKFGSGTGVDVGKETAVSNAVGGDLADGPSTVELCTPRDLIKSCILLEAENTKI